MSQWYQQYPVTETYNPPSEYGIDIATPYHTPITAPFGGQVFQADYQPWGGEVGIKANVPGYGLVNEYVQHLDLVNVSPGQTVTAGQVLGLSGGQTSGGNHPTSPQYSSGPHTEIGFGAPWIGGGSNFDPTKALSMATNIDPSSIVSSIASTLGLGNSGSTSSASGGNSVNVGPVSIPLPSNDFWIRGGLVVVGILLLIVGVYGLVARPEVVVQEEK